VRNDGDAKVGAAVQVSLAEGALLHSALLMYVLPLLLMLAGALLAAYWAAADNADAYSALGAVLGLGLGFLLAKMLSLRKRMLSVCRPVICPR
jgi:sigma-E factor negative regulatory protein RseC